MPRTNVLTKPSTDEIRREATGQLDPARRAALGQFMTPSSVATFMASLFQTWPLHVRLLDPGAGTGSLTSAFAEEFQKSAPSGTRLSISAYEIEDLLEGYLTQQLRNIQSVSQVLGRSTDFEVIPRDFIQEGAFALSFGAARYSHVIMNPPYKKMGGTSEYRLLLRKEGIEAVNLYVAFLGLAVALTEKQGEIVAIVPRSFCNGAYFRPFRKWLLERVAIRQVHVFESRKKAFHDDNILQENIILCLERGTEQGSVVISTSHDPSFSDFQKRTVPFEQIVKPKDDESYIHLPTSELTQSTYLFHHTLKEIGLEVATGPVVDFRLRKYWQQEPTENSAPLLYTHHIAGGEFRWPREHKKPNALEITPESQKWLMPRGWYTLIKRFSSKEEKRRLVAFVLDPKSLPYKHYGFENHLNVIHAAKQGIDPNLARGIALFLNSTIVDLHFRSFSGHTQVNATDLRMMLFPSRQTLIRFGKWAAKRAQLSQEEIDAFIESSHGH